MQQKVLLIFPNNFYSFRNSFVSELNSRGFEVDIVDDLYPSFSLIKGISRFYPKLLYRYTTYVIKKKLFEIDSKSYDYIIITRGKGISKELITFLKRTYSAKTIGYNWDSFRNNPSPLDWYHLIDSYFTFDYNDSLELGLPILDLFASNVNLKNNEIIERLYVSAVFSNHSKRLVYLDKCLNNIKHLEGFSPKIYIYEKSFFLGVFSFINSPILFIKYFKYIHFKPLNYEAYVNLMRQSLITIDYAHNKQSGLTMRCFEAIAYGAAVITNNEYIKKTPNIFDDDYFLYSNGDFDLIKFKSFIQSILKNGIKSKPRSINTFFDELLNVE